jgi:hypothetical protein
VIDRRDRLGGVPEALRYLGEGQAKGKLVAIIKQLLAGRRGGLGIGHDRLSNCSAGDTCQKNETCGGPAPGRRIARSKGTWRSAQPSSPLACL